MVASKVRGLQGPHRWGSQFTGHSRLHGVSYVILTCIMSNMKKLTKLQNSPQKNINTITGSWELFQQHSKLMFSTSLPLFDVVIFSQWRSWWSQWELWGRTRWCSAISSHTICFLPPQQGPFLPPLHTPLPRRHRLRHPSHPLLPPQHPYHR